MGKAYNQGSDDDKRAAVSAISDYTKLLITLATGAVALSATFLSQFYRGHWLAGLVWSWSLLGGSIFFGAIAIGAVISQLAESNVKPRRGALEVLNLAQLLLLLVGVGLFAGFAVANATAAPQLSLESTVSSLKSSGNFAVRLFCGTGSGGTCALTVRVDFDLEQHHITVAPIHTSVPADVDANVQLTVPAAVRAAVQAGRTVVADCTVHGTSHFGGPTTIRREVRLTAAR